MKILINTDRHVEAESNLTQQLEQDISSELERFDKQLTRVEVYLSDQNADKGGTRDVRCVMEARPAGMQPIAITESAATLQEACSGAVTKIAKLLESNFGRIESRRGRDSIRRAK